MQAKRLEAKQKAPEEKQCIQHSSHATATKIRAQDQGKDLSEDLKFSFGISERQSLSGGNQSYIGVL